MSFQKYLDANKFHSFEGDSGMKKLETICKEIGYQDTGLKFGTPIESFLSDNSGAMQLLVDFIEEHFGEQFEEEENIEYSDDEEETQEVREIMDHEDRIEILQSIAEDLGGTFTDIYSGRNMFGKRCCGISYRDSISIIEECAEQGIKGGLVDNMGKDYIVYFPNITKTE